MGIGMTPDWRRDGMLHGMEIRARHEADVDAATALLERHHSLARMGRLERPLDYPALVAVDPKMVGLLTYIVNAPTAEIPTLQVDRQWGGIGTQLLQGAKRLARGAGCRRLWLITTNDNVDALRLPAPRLSLGAATCWRCCTQPRQPKAGDPRGRPARHTDS